MVLIIMMRYEDNLYYGREGKKENGGPVEIGRREQAKMRFVFVCVCSFSGEGGIRMKEVRGIWGNRRLYATI